MSTCGATCGITKERAKELENARATAERVHPGFVWSSAAQRSPRAVPHDALVQLGATLEEILPVRVCVRAGDPGECDSLYVLAGLHRPCILELENEVRLPASLTRDETYVRIAVSPHGPFATLSEVVVSAEVDDLGLAVTMEPQAGVIDRRLQHIIKGLQGALRRERLSVLDLAAVLAPIEGPTQSPELSSTFDEHVSLWSLIFEPLSPLAPRSHWLPRDEQPRLGERSTESLSL